MHSGLRMRASIAALATVVAAGCGGGLLPAAQESPTPPAPELHTVRIGIVALNAFIQLPLGLGLQLGYFTKRGIAIQTVDESSGSAALADLGSGKVDVISVPYEFTLRAQMAGNNVAAIALYQLRPGFVMSVGKPHFNDVHSMKDLVGRPVCITARGTQAESNVRWLAIHDGVDPSAIPLRACGTATAAYSTMLANGQVWGAIQVDPPFSKLEREGWARPLYDTRTEQGAKQVYGGAGIYPRTSLALVRAIVEALRYIHSHSASDTASHMPAEYKQGDPDLYASSLKNNLEMFSVDGVMPAGGAAEVLKVFDLVQPDASEAHMDISQTFDNSFAQRASSG
jgi:NitT/TauT family transport system substrate-binding protein